MSPHAAIRRASGAPALAAALFAAALAVPAPAGATAGEPPGKAGPCARAITAVERAGLVPPHLLTAVSLAESGRPDPARRGEIVAWPWTINADGRGRFFATKREAVAAVRRLRAQGVTSIDVGCMQVNLHYHPDAFADLDQAFDPARNVAYAARFLKRLRDERRSWSRAVALYHSATREYNRPYRRKVYRLWYEVRRAAAERRREALLRAARERRAASRGGDARPRAGESPS